MTTARTKKDDSAATPAAAAPIKATATKKTKAVAPKKDSEHPTYKDMIIAALVHLKERNGSSRQALKKYIQGNYSVGESSDQHFNAAIKRGVEAGDFLQPKGSSGPVKLAKKEPKKKVVKEKKEPKEKKAKKPAAKKAAAPKKAAAKKETTKKAAPKKATAVKKASKKAEAKKPAAKKAAAPKKTAAPKEKKAKATKKTAATKA
ncbi:hypothetical protein BGZ75_002170 [Mortierella antarctica]|nr:hypothetical protein BGZ75_002170 [Mortierella antarctica]